MSSRLRSLDSRISFFAFADIITAVSGVLIFVALLLATDLGRPTHRSSAADPELEQQLRETLDQQLEADAENRRLQELLSSVETAPDPEKLRADIGRLQSQLVVEQRKEKAVANQMAGSAAAIATRDKALGLTDLKASIEHKNQEAEGVEKQDNQARSEIENLEQQVTRIESQLLNLRERDGQVWLIPDKSTTTKEPILVTLSGAGMTIEHFDHPDQRRQSDAGNADEALKTYLRTVKPVDEYVVFLIRPSGISLFKDLVETARASGFEVGYDALEEDRQVHFSTPPPVDEPVTTTDTNGAATAQSPPLAGGSSAETSNLPAGPATPEAKPQATSAPPPLKSKSWWQRLLEWAGMK